MARQRAATKAFNGKLNAEVAREIITRGVAEVMEAAGLEMPGCSVREWSVQWLALVEAENSAGTYSRYSLAVNALVKFLAKWADRDISTVSSKEVVAFRSWCVSTCGLAVETTNTHLRIIKTMFSRAIEPGLISKSPAEHVELLKERGASRRRPMTLDEIQRAMAQAGDSEWRGMILVGLYTGQRLQDCAALTWRQVDLEKKSIEFTTKKTGRHLSMHLAKPLLEHLTGLPSSDDTAARVFPVLSAVSNLSNKFAVEILIPSGLMPAREPQKMSEWKGRSGPRAFNAITFHSLRHNLTSWLKASGASNAMAQMIIGHASPAVSRRYTHLDEADTVESISKLPDVTATSVGVTGGKTKG